VWVASPFVGLGYFNRPEETVETFQARLAGDAGTPFLRTGDLGFLADGELFLTGRLKDLIIVRGKNHYPQDLELTVERCHPAIRPGCVAAFPLEGGDVERVGLAAEVDTRRGPPDVDEITAAILRSVLAEHDLSASLVALLEPSLLPKTSSGKLQRRAARAGLVDGTLSPLHRWEAPASGELEPLHDGVASGRAEAEPQEAEVRRFLTEWAARKLERPLAEIDPTRPIAEYGMDSVMLVELASALEEWLGRSIDLGLTAAHPTLEELSRHLIREG
jgi:phthiocerol/phenolphthiocerol synthesis type-I polyketide synthase C